VKVDIFDILGRKIQTLVNESQAAGYHQVTWKADDVPSGMYFYRIQTGNNTQTRKCLLIK
jgi:flagellar hook assembly protein FlgD